MTEVEWLACTDPEKMLLLLEGKVTERKLRLSCVAWRRRIRSGFSDWCWHFVELAERFADELGERRK